MPEIAVNSKATCVVNFQLVGAIMSYVDPCRRCTSTLSEMRSGGASDHKQVIAAQNVLGRFMIRES